MEQFDQFKECQYLESFYPTFRKWNNWLHQKDYLVCHGRSLLVLDFKKITPIKLLTFLRVFKRLVVKVTAVELAMINDMFKNTQVKIYSALIHLEGSSLNIQKRIKKLKIFDDISPGWFFEDLKKTEILATSPSLQELHIKCGLTPLPTYFMWDYRDQLKTILLKNQEQKVLGSISIQYFNQNNQRVGFIFSGCVDKSLEGKHGLGVKIGYIAAKAAVNKTDIVTSIVLEKNRHVIRYLEKFGLATMPEYRWVFLNF